jgi:uncharacterized protein YacL
MARKIQRKIEGAGATELHSIQESPGKGPVYALIVALVIIFIVLGILLYLNLSESSMPKIEPWVIFLVVFIAIAAIVYELAMKPNIYLWNWMQKKHQEDSEEEGNETEGEVNSKSSGNMGKVGKKNQT